MGGWADYRPGRVGSEGTLLPSSSTALVKFRMGQLKGQGFCDSLRNRSGILRSQPEQGVAQMILKSPPLSQEGLSQVAHREGGAVVGRVPPWALQFEGGLGNQRIEWTLPTQL